MTSGSSGTILPAGTAYPTVSFPVACSRPPGRTGIDARGGDGEREPLACEGHLSLSEGRAIADATAIVSESVEQQGYRAANDGCMIQLDEVGKPAEHCPNESDV